MILNNIKSSALHNLYTVFFSGRFTFHIEFVFFYMPNIFVNKFFTTKKFRYTYYNLFIKIYIYAMYSDFGSLYKKRLPSVLEVD